MKFLRTALDKYKRGKPIQSASVTDFSGGLNTTEDDISISSKFAKVLKNLYYGQDGKLRLRYGYKTFCNLATGAIVNGNVIEMEYYNEFLIVVTSQGEIAKVNAAGVAVKIWPTGVPGEVWTNPTTFASFVQFRGSCIISNGVDKPVIITSAMVIGFLKDIPSASNINTPICKYMAVSKQYLVMAGQSANPSKVYISAKQASGTWSGDPAPNDATTIDIGAAIQRGDAVILGLAALNNSVFVFLEDAFVVLQLGEYDATGLVHLPNIFDSSPNFGAITHRTIRTVYSDLMYVNLAGVVSMERNQLATAFVPTQRSKNVEVDLQRDLTTLRLQTRLETAFAIFNRQTSQYMLFLKPTAAGTQTCWVFTTNKAREVDSWAQFIGWDFDCACISSLGRMFLAKNKLISVYGSQAAQDEFFTDGATVTPITFDWELPWSVFKEYDNVKKIHSIRLYTRGTAEFTMQLFCDGVYQDESGLYLPAASMNFIGGDSPGYGGGDQPFGGGRVTSDPRIFAFPGKFIQGKFRFTGSASVDLQFVGMSIAYAIGGRKR